MSSAIVERGKLLPRERVELLLDEGSYFLEIAPLAGIGIDDEAPGARVIGGIGLCRGRECMIIANEATAKGGSTGEAGPWKNARLADIARENRLPTILLVESAGADLPVQSKIFVPGGRGFREITRRSKLPHSHHLRRVRQFHRGRRLSARHVGLRGHGEEAGAGVPGRSAAGQDGDGRNRRTKNRWAARKCIRASPDFRITWPKTNWTASASRAKSSPISICRSRPRRSTQSSTSRSTIADELLGIASADVRVPFEVREVIARIVDGSRFSEFKAEYGPTLVTGFARIHGFPVGILGQQRRADVGIVGQRRAVHRAVQPARHPAGLSAEHHRVHGRPNLRRAGHHSQRREADQRGIELHRAGHHDHDRRILRGGELRHVRARLRAAIPVHLAESSHRRDGPAAALGRDGHHQARIAASKPGSRSTKTKLGRRTHALEDQIQRESDCYFATARLWDDGIIDPRDTRTVLAISLSAAYNRAGRRNHGVGRLPPLTCVLSRNFLDAALVIFRHPRDGVNLHSSFERRFETHRVHVIQQMFGQRNRRCRTFAPASRRKLRPQCRTSRRRTRG